MASSNSAGSLRRRLPRALVGTHIIFKTPSGELQAGVLRCVQKGRVGTTVIHLAGIELDRPRAAGSTKDGIFQGVKVLECRPGHGFVCEEAALMGKIRRARGTRKEEWLCEICRYTNKCLAVSSFAEYMALDVDQLREILACNNCSAVRVWYCPHRSCMDNGPLEVASLPGGSEEDICETMTCPNCRRPPLEWWPCPVCDSSCSTEFCETCDPEKKGQAPARDTMMLLQHLKTYRWARNPFTQPRPPTPVSPVHDTAGPVPPPALPFSSTHTGNDYLHPSPSHATLEPGRSASTGPYPSQVQRDGIGSPTAAGAGGGASMGARNTAGAGGPGAGGPGAGGPGGAGGAGYPVAHQPPTYGLPAPRLESPPPVPRDLSGAPTHTMAVSPLAASPPASRPRSRGPAADAPAPGQGHPEVRLGLEPYSSGPVEPRPASVSSKGRKSPRAVRSSTPKSRASKAGSLKRGPRSKSARSASGPASRKAAGTPNLPAPSPPLPSASPKEMVENSPSTQLVAHGDNSPAAALKAAVAQFHAATKAVELAFEAVSETAAETDREAAKSLREVADDSEAVRKLAMYHAMLAAKADAEEEVAHAANNLRRSKSPSAKIASRLTAQRQLAQSPGDAGGSESEMDRNPAPTRRKKPAPRFPSPEMIDMEPEFTPRLPFHHLMEEHVGNKTVEAAIRILRKRYSHWRATHDDGNCFYRSLFIGYIEHCVANSDSDGIIRMCDRLETVSESEPVREWLATHFAKPLLRFPGRCAQRCAAVLDSMLAENDRFDKIVVLCLRRKTAEFIRSSAGLPQADGLTLEEELLLSADFDGTIGELVRQSILRMGEPTTPVVQRAAMQALGICARIVDLTGPRITMRTINGGKDPRPQCHLLRSDVGQFDILVPMATRSAARSPSAALLKQQAMRRRAIEQDASESETDY